LLTSGDQRSPAVGRDRRRVAALLYLIFVWVLGVVR
jgi:hypothetical protein